MIGKGMGTAALAVLLVCPWAGIAIAALPFITDDAGTQGKGTSQIELLYARSTDKESVDGSGVKTDRNLPGATFGYGVAETFDLTLGVARSWGTETVEGFSSNDSGNADYLLNAKWQFYEKAGFRFAVKPLVGYSYHVGGTSDDHVTLYGGWLIVTQEHEGLAVSLNGGYFLHRLRIGGGARRQPEQHLEHFGPRDVRGSDGSEAGTGYRSIGQPG